jgi:outer membrane protein assembly factor BamB
MVHAMDLATGVEQPGWPVLAVWHPTQDHVYGGLTMSNGTIYVTSASHCDAAPYHGAVVAINVASHSAVNYFLPSGLLSGGGIWGPGGVSIDPANGHVFTATGNAIGTPENHLYSEALVELTPSLGVVNLFSPQPVGGDNDFGATPILFQPTGCPSLLAAAKRKSGQLVIAREGAERRTGYQIQIASGQDWQFNGIPAWDPQTQMLYIGNSSDSSAYEHGMVALQAHPNCSLTPAWQDEVGPNLTSVSPPTVAGGLVYYGDGPGNTEYAFNAATGAQLWNSEDTIDGGLYAAPMVANSELVVPAWDDNLYAFGP